MADDATSTEIQIVLLPEAKALGLKHYFTGVPCPQGHLSRRSIRSRVCLRCAADIEKRRRAEHPEKVKYRYRSYIDRDPERVKSNNREWRKKNADKVKVLQKINADRMRETNPKHYWSISALCGSKRRARAARVPYNLSREYLLSIAGDTCPALGLPLIYSAKTGGGAHHASATIDRIVPELGYVIGNVAVISFRANSIKRDATCEELSRIAKWVGERLKA